MPTEVILIDDDPLVREAWKMRMTKLGRRLQVYASTADFSADLANIPHGMLIFIDSSLNESLRGEIFAKQLAEKGFHNIFLATGYPASSFPPMPWLKGIVSKEPPDWV